jgi:hypothetical protein
LIDPKDKQRLRAVAQKAGVSMSEFVRRRLMERPTPDERAWLDAVIALGEKAERAFAAADVRMKEEAAAEAAHQRRLRKVREQVMAAFTE